MNKPNLILASDLHIRETKPECRTDDYMEAQKKKLLFLKSLQKKYECPVLVPGDIYDHWKPSPWLLSWSMKYMPKNMYTIPGQHDLKNNSLKLIRESGLFVLKRAKIAKVLLTPKLHVIAPLICVFGYPFSSKLSPNTNKTPKYRNIALCHVMAYTKESKPWEGLEGGEARRIMKKLKGFDLVVTGDNHKPFVYKHKGRLLVNPGSMMRMEADEGDCKPRVYLWYAKENEVKPVYYPIQEGVVSREHIEVVEKRDRRVEAFVKRLKKVPVELALSYEKNVKKFMNKNKIEDDVKEIVMECME